ncbi:type II toxin-antitoxin system RelE/ParE family toxin [Caulobacter sp. DWP3-1-3b2]|uniref:type II toxin-antitoxin system RelE/ParE family toxin n=1 Tax=Caulobacter sp. DWP3-1-3b2 TaxID=2804643 RepID=UPI003CF9F251
MKAYRLSHGARRDLGDIWDYSRDHWGARRAASYLHDLRATIGLIAEHPGVGTVLEAPDHAFRKRPVGSHVIFYRLEAGVVEIVRILHQNMDATRRLPGLD